MHRKSQQQQFLADFILSNQASYYRLACSYVKNTDDALDIVQESICKAMTSSKYPQKLEEVKPWFYRIVINTSIDFLRKNKLLDPVREEVLEISIILENTCENMDLYQALDSLPLNCRSVIVLRYFEDLKIEEIAVILGENVNTVKTRLYAALKKLRLQLED